jgi:hypothetical protein
MTKDDDLVKRLRAVDHLSVEDCFLQSPLYGDAADRIEALTEARDMMGRLWAKEAAERQVALGRIDELEAKLAKAVQALDKIAGKAPYADDPYDIARTTLAELKGDKT